MVTRGHSSHMTACREARRTNGRGDLIRKTSEVNLPAKALELSIINEKAVVGPGQVWDKSELKLAA